MLAFCAIGPRAAYRVTAVLADWLNRLMPELSARAVRQLRQSLGESWTDAQLERLAAESLRHRLWNLTDLHLTPRWLTPRSYRRLGGAMPEPYLARTLAAQRRGQPALLLTAYFGSFDLLPVLLGYNGITAAIVYRRHRNTAFDRFRDRVRTISGSTLIPLENALVEVPRVLERGGTVAMLVDQPEPARGIDVEFLGRPLRVNRAVGVLAVRHGADVAVAGLARRGAFRFDFRVSDVIDHTDWLREADPVAYVTRRYVGALERLVRDAPAQYLWLQERWRER